MLKAIGAFFGILFFIILVGAIIGFSTGYIQNFYDSTVTKQQMNIERTNYEQSASYVQGVVNDLSKQKLEYDKSTDQTAKMAILNYVNDRYASFDVNKINDPALQSFLLKARGE